MRLPFMFLSLCFLTTLFAAACSSNSDDEQYTPPEVSAPSPMLPPEVLRESVGEVLELSTTARGGDSILTTDNWAIESVSVFPLKTLQKGDWVDLITVRIDEETVFQYLCVAQALECHKVFRIRRNAPRQPPPLPQGQRHP